MLITPEDRFLKRTEVIQLTGLSTASIYRKMKDGTFPKAVRLGSRAVAWVQSEITDWQGQAIQNRNQVTSEINQ
jgi:prophage regulatory protein